MHSADVDITLYRGDFNKIEEFDFHKTHPACYVGQGVYLTDSRSVADTYRSKGARYDFTRKDRFNYYQLAEFQTKAWVGRALNRGDALRKCCEAYPEVNVLDLHQAGLLKIEYETANTYYNRPDAKGERPMVVKYTGRITVGHLSIFKFPRRKFLNEMIDFRRNNITDPGILEVLVEKGLVASDAREYTPDRNQSGKIFRPRYRKPREDNFRRLRAVLEPYGFKGIWYNGGVATGNERHNAFVVWDDEYVNQNRVQ